MMCQLLVALYLLGFMVTWNLINNYLLHNRKFCLEILIFLVWLEILDQFIH